MTKKIDDIRIVKVINDFDIVINKGSNDGVSEYMNFLVYELGDEIIDPVTNKSLGTLEIAKGKFRVKHIQESLTTLESDEYDIEKSHKIFTFTEFIEKRKQQPIKNIKLTDKVKTI
jgi:hypothetical protein